MTKKPHKTSVLGIDARAPRLTAAGYWALIKFGAVPLLGVLLALDIAGYVIAKFVFGSCYGVLCWF